MINEIIHGDCLDIMPGIPDEYIDLVVTDPPYLINYHTNRRKDKSHDFCNPIDNDDNREVIKSYIKECSRIMKENTAVYMFCSYDNVDFFKQEIEKYFTLKNIIVWVKNSWTAGDLQGQFGKQYEMIILATKGRSIIRGKRFPDVWDCRRIVGKWQYHQNQKPLGIIERCIESHSDKEAVVFDGFAGSGTTAIACHSTGRNFICIEKDKQYVEIARKRYKDHTAQTRLPV